MASFYIRALLAFSTRSDSGEMCGVEGGGRKAEERERERETEGGRQVGSIVASSLSHPPPPRSLFPWSLFFALSPLSERLEHVRESLYKELCLYCFNKLLSTHFQANKRSYLTCLIRL